MIKIVTDSTSDIPASEITRLGIIVIPMLIQIEGQTQRDGQTISREQFYAGLPTYGEFPKTAACSPGDMVDAYQAIAADMPASGPKQIVAVHIGRKISGVCAAADIAAAQVRDDGIEVRVIDSEFVTLGLGVLVIRAAELAQQGRSIDEIVAAVELMRKQVRVVALADTLKYLRKGGRVSALNATVGELLQIKPMVEVQNGSINALDRVRTRSRGIEQLIEQCKRPPYSCTRITSYALIMTGGSDQSKDLAHVRAALSPIAPFQFAEPVLVTPVVGAHFGPNGFGLVIIGQ